jgi:hypothetical protein
MINFKTTALVIAMSFGGIVYADDAAAFPTCIAFSPAGFCDGMEYDSNKKATWHNYDCAGSMGAQTKASYKKGTTVCTGSTGCNPAAAYGWDSLDWKFNLSASTGTLTGVSGGVKTVLQNNIPVSITSGACSFARTNGGVSSLAH